jgi:hypothetical protein
MIWLFQNFPAEIKVCIFLVLLNSELFSDNTGFFGSVYLSLQEVCNSKKH